MGIRRTELESEMRLSSARLSLLKAGSGVLAHFEKKYPVLNLHVESPKKEQTA